MGGLHRNNVKWHQITRCVCFPVGRGGDGIFTAAEPLLEEEGTVYLLLLSVACVATECHRFLCCITGLTRILHIRLVNYTARANHATQAPAGCRRLYRSALKTRSPCPTPQLPLKSCIPNVKICAVQVEKDTYARSQSSISLDTFFLSFFMMSLNDAHQFSDT